MRTYKLQLHAGTEQGRTLEGEGEKNLALIMTKPLPYLFKCHWALIECSSFSRFYIAVPKALGVSFNFDKYSNVCIISTLQF